MIEKNIRLVWKVIKDIGLYNSQDSDDLFQIGCIGLMKGAKTYNGNANESTYLYTCVRNEIFRYMCYNKRAKRNSCNDISLYHKVDDTYCLCDLIESDVNVEEQAENNAIISEIKELLNKSRPADKKIFYLYYGLENGIEYNMAEISRMLGMTPPNVKYRLDIVTKMLKNHYLQGEI